MRILKVFYKKETFCSFFFFKYKNNSKYHTYLRSILSIIAIILSYLSANNLIQDFINKNNPTVLIQNNEYRRDIGLDSSLFAYLFKFQYIKLELVNIKSIKYQLINLDNMTNTIN